MPKSNRMLRGGSNAGLARLSGGVGFGFERAGNQMVNLGNSYVKQENYDASITAAEKEKKANIAANAAHNMIVNPKQSTAFKAGYDGDGDVNEALGRVKLSAPAAKEGFTLKNGEARFNADGKQLVKLDKPAAPKETKKTITDDNDFVHVVFDDGSTKNTGVKSKDYWQSKGGGGSGTKGKIPNGYVLSKDLPTNIMTNEDLYDGLSEVGALLPDKTTGHMYVNKAKYDRYMKLRNTDIK